MFNVKTFKWLVISGPAGVIEANVASRHTVCAVTGTNVRTRVCCCCVSIMWLLLDAICMVCRYCSCLKVVAGLVVAFVIPPLIVIRVQKTLLSTVCFGRYSRFLDLI